jgi:outer membrane receptor protein involved in Fe transport
MARLAGANVALVGLERDRTRLDVAKTYGCDVIIGDAMPWARERDGLGADGVIDAAGASAAYGSDATSGVINIILRRGFDGAMTQVGVTASPQIGYVHSQIAQLYGHTWDTGNITASYTFTAAPNVPAEERDYYSQDYRPWGLQDSRPRTSSIPGTVHVGNAITVNWPDPGNPTPPVFSANFGTEYCGSSSATWPLCYSIPRGQNGVGLTWDIQAPLDNGDRVDLAVYFLPGNRVIVEYAELHRRDSSSSENLNQTVIVTRDFGRAHA